MPTVTGLAIPYGVEATFHKRGQPHREVIARGAFAEAVRRDRAFACLNHRPARRIGRELRLREDDAGVWFELTDARIPRRCTGVSVRLVPVRWRYEPHRAVLLQADIAHVSLLTEPMEPAYPCTLQHLRETEG